MACLEVLTGEPPFSDIKSDWTVFKRLDHGEHPKLPLCPRVSDPLWSLFKKCWNKKPASRLTISVIRQKIAEIRGLSAVNRPAGRLIHSLSNEWSLTEISASSPAQEMQRRASILGFRRTDKRRDSTSSSGSPTQMTPLQGFVEEPEYIARGTFYSNGRSSREPPRLEVILDHDGWRLETRPGTSRLGSGSEQHVTSSSASPVIPPESSPLSLRSPSSVGTSDSWSRYNTSTRAAVTDTNIVVRLLRDGTVTSGTLEGLVERLINGFGEHFG
jgi:son of sevenless-like protein